MTMETTADRIEYSVGVLTRVLKSEQQRVRTGIAVRQLIRDRVAKGLKTDHYRVDWLRTSMIRLTTVLEVFAREFNEAHPKDKVSNHDLVDLLTDCISAIVRVS